METTKLSELDYSPANYGLGTGAPTQRKCFRAKGLFWSFYYGQDIVTGNFSILYKTSSDGITWSRSKSIDNLSQSGVRFTVWYDELSGNIHYVRLAGTYLFHRMGVLRDDGKMELGQETLIDGDAGNVQSLCVDSSGLPWVAFRRSSKNIPVVAKSQTPDKWLMADGFPFALTDESATSYWRTCIVPLLSGDIYVVYNPEFFQLRGRLWNGSWQREEIFSELKTWEDAAFSAVAFGDTVYIVYGASASTRLCTRYPDGKWIEVALPMTSGVWPTLSIDTQGNLYIFWTDDSGVKCISNRSGTWEVNSLFDDTPAKGWCINSFYKGEDYIGVMWTHPTRAPYKAVFGAIRLVAEPLPPTPYRKEVRYTKQQWEDIVNIPASHYVEAIEITYNDLSQEWVFDCLING